MTWFRVDDKFAFHPKAVRAGNEAVGVWVRLGAWSSDQMTDGAIPRDVATLIANGNQGALDQLVAAGLLVATATGYQMHDFLDWNPSAKQVKRQRKADAERKRGLRPASKKTPAGVRPDSSSPDPDPDPDPGEKRDPPKPPDGGQGFKLDPPEPKKPRGKRAAKEPKATAADAYLAAFVAGIGDAGHAVTRPRNSDAGMLGNACRTHAVKDGAPIVGAALPPWIRAQAAAFRRAITQPHFWKAGISVVGLIAWWDAGRPTQAPTFTASDDNPDDWDPPQPEPPVFPPRPLPPNATPAMRDSGLAWAVEKGLIPPERAHG